MPRGPALEQGNDRDRSSAVRVERERGGGQERSRRRESRLVQGKREKGMKTGEGRWAVVLDRVGSG
jgi:hypothetical protein